jgi:serine/threonine-protein kinase
MFFVKVYLPCKQKKDVYELLTETRNRYHFLNELKNAQNLPVLAPTEYGLCSEGIYMISPWIEGESIDFALKKSTGRKNEYYLGEKSGKLLKQLHEIKISSDASRIWQQEFSRGLNKAVRKYQNCGIRFDGDDAVIEYLNNKHFLLENRPICLSHGDYDNTNTLIHDTSSELIMIDTDTLSLGDPYYEFRFLVKDCYCTPSFSTGFVNGYFSSLPDDLFWELIRFYFCEVCLSSIAYKSKDAPETGRLNRALSCMENYLESFANNHIPSWYLGNSSDCIQDDCEF